MTQKTKTKIEKPLTEVELQMMNAIWDLGECTVKEVQVLLSKEKELAYTSVATIMKILEQKGFLRSTKNDRAHTYISLITRQEYEKTSLKHLAKNVFKDDPSSMVMRLLNDSKLSQEELQKIQKILDERLRS